MWGLPASRATYIPFSYFYTLKTVHGVNDMLDEVIQLVGLWWVEQNILSYMDSVQHNLHVSFH
jgi:hypothetical protein